MKNQKTLKRKTNPFKWSVYKGKFNKINTKIMKKYEGSKLDKKLDKKMGYKEGSKKDKIMDKKMEHLSKGSIKKMVKKYK